VAEQPVEARSERDAQDRGPEYPIFPTAYEWRPPVPRVVVKADLLPALSTLSTVSLLGLAVGWVWSLLAPPQRMLVYTDGQAYPLTNESYHRFDDLVIFMFLCLAAGIVTGVAIWYLRERRGPVMMLAAVGGSAIAGWLALTVGKAWATDRWPLPTNVKPDDVVTAPPVLESGWALIAWPLMTALAYGILAAMNGMDDLGRRLG
jgi:hypothetical protein